MNNYKKDINKKIKINNAGIGAKGCNHCIAKIIGDTLNDNQESHNGLLKEDNGFYVLIIDKNKTSYYPKIGDIWKVNLDCEYEIINN